MCTSDSVFKNLRQKLDVMGYKQTLPLTAVPIVGAVFEDLVKTTESLRDSKKQLIELLEEKSCWELGIEPYKCDNSRLLAECNELHLQLMQQKENYEEQRNGLNKTIRDLQTDRSHLQLQCEKLQNHLCSMQSKTNIGVVRSDTKTEKGKKPFITTVRSGDTFSPAVNILQDHNIDLRCIKCNAGFYQKHDGTTQTKSIEKDIDRWENTRQELMENVKFYRNKVEARDREILRLNELLSGGRAPNVLARECCYKNVGNLNEDIDLLQREKLESLARIREYQHQMHEAMRKALSLENFNKELQKRLDELKDAALSVETQANNEIIQKEAEIEQLKQQLQRLHNKTKVKNEKSKESEKLQRNNQNKDMQLSVQMEKHRFNEKLNELTQKESELRAENDRLVKKLTKLKNKLQASHKEIQDLQLRHTQQLDEEKIRLKSERDFFQKEYLRILNKVGSEREIDFLQSQIKSKDEELRILRSEMCLKQSQALVPCLKSSTDFDNLPTSLPSSARSATSTGSSDCVQAVILRAERERDCARNDLERVRCERDTLREKMLCMTKMHDEQIQNAQRRYEELNRKLQQIEKEKRDLISALKPSETQIILLKEEMDAYKQQKNKFKDENNKLQSTNNSLKLLHEQTERSLADCQNKLIISESQLQSANARLNAIDSNRETSQDEVVQLRSEVAALKQTYMALEREKDKILTQLDLKTEKANQLEYELKASKESRNTLEKKVNDFEQELSKLTNQKRECASELQETSTESKSLREQITALKISREQAVMENAHLTNNLAESQAEIITLKKLLKDSEGEVIRLKQQLRQYVQEIKKAEDLLMHKEKEREEILEHYRNLSNDAVILEGSNQSLENEAAECRRQLNESESEIHILKEELCSRNSLVNELEDKLASQQVHNKCLKQKLEESLDEQRLLETDLTARKELCRKLDNEKDKLNAELSELNNVKQNLEAENEKLRLKIQKMEKNKRISSETLEELLSKTRHDLEEQIKADSKLSHELLHLKQRNEELLVELDVERQRRLQHETLVREYQIQNQELRHTLTDDRFHQARSREQSPHFHTKTL